MQDGAELVQSETVLRLVEDAVAMLVEMMQIQQTLAEFRIDGGLQPVQTML